MLEHLKRVAICVGLLAVPTLPNAGQQSCITERPKDERLHRLRAFFQAAGSPVEHLAEDFLAAADRYRLDWRLLPSICIVESGGGKRFINNNIFGWDSGQRAFESVREGIYVVASRLAHSRLYRDKDLSGLLATYNPRNEWGALVRALMRRMETHPPLPPPEGARVIPSSGRQSTVRPAPAR
jgi:hypothetical protein